MTKSLRKTLGLFLSLCILAPNLVMGATFNPNFILSDEEMQNWSSMSRPDIQAFLNDHGGYIKTLFIEDSVGEKRNAADIIYRAAEEHRINPKYILVKLQKEQSLITETDPTQYQLDWATGYGCPDGSPCKEEHRGFGKQVNKSAGVIRWYYDNVNVQSWIKRPNVEYSIDSTPIQPANYATAFLYTYTPHLHGNANFWKLWQQWFDQTYPDGTLVRSAEEPMIYLIQDRKRRPFVSMAALATRYNPKLVVTAPQSELNRYELGSNISLPNYSILRQGSNYYLLEYDMLRPFESEEVVKKLGYHPDEIIDVQMGDIATLLVSTTPIVSNSTAPLGELFLVKENNQLYYILNNTYHPLYDAKVADVNYPHLKAKTVSAIELQNMTKGDPIPYRDGTLLAINGSPRVFVLEKGKKRHIPSEEVFNGLGYAWGNIIWSNEFMDILHPTGEPLYMKPASASASASTPSIITPTAPAISTTNATITPAPTSPTSPITPISELSAEEKAIQAKMVKTPADKVAFTGPVFDTHVDAYLVAEYSSGNIVAGKNIDTVRPMASFVKNMTAYQALANGFDLNSKTVYEAGKHKTQCSCLPVAELEVFLNKDLLYALLVSSLNTAAPMIVSNLSSEAKFVEQMNATTASWSLPNTKFYDTTGLDERNVTTAREFLTLFTKTTSNQTIREISGMKQYEYFEITDYNGTAKHADVNSNKLMAKKGLPFTILASKTGYLHKAGTGLSMLVERNNDKKQFIIITMGNPDYKDRFVEPEKLTTWAMSTF